MTEIAEYQLFFETFIKKAECLKTNTHTATHWTTKIFAKSYLLKITHINDEYKKKYTGKKNRKINQLK